MPDAEYEWWIDQKVRDKDGILHVTRLRQKGSIGESGANSCDCGCKTGLGSITHPPSAC